MGAHEQLEQFLSATPRTKLIVTFAAIAVVIAVLLGVFYWGVRSGDGWAESRYTRERDENLKKIARYEQNERQFAAENAFLKKQNEATAEILKANDKKLAGDAGKFTDLLKQRNEKLQTIDADNDFDAQLCGLCADAAGAGFALSDTTCGRCKAAP